MIRNSLIAAALLMVLGSGQASVFAAPSSAPGLGKPNSTHTVHLMNTPRPLFFSDLVALDTQNHRSLTLPAQRKDFAFAASAHLLPLTVAEVSAALQNYPIVFVQEGDVVALVALTGLPDTGNRFVDSKGAWRTGAYIPAYVRGYPFIAVRSSKDAEPIIAFDPHAADFKAKEGQPLVGAEGQPSETLKGILAFHGEYQGLAERTRAMTAALKTAGVLEEGQMTLQAPNAKPAQIGGFLVVNEAKLRALSAETLKQLMDADALGLAYAHLFSMGNLKQLIEEKPVAADASSRRRPGKNTAE